MQKQLTNIHTHIFNGTCAPDYFFKMALPKWLDRWSEEIKAFIEKKSVRWVIRKMQRLVAKISGKDRGTAFKRYLDFIEIGTQSSQHDVFTILRNSYNSLSGDMKFVALTLNMDYMDTLPSNHARIEDQLAEIERVRSYYPNQLFPFVCVDPRHLRGQELVRWVEEKVRRKAFFGIKMYPALGFFPFDPGLDELYKWAEDNQVPIMTHCTRSGSYYTGHMLDVIPYHEPQSLNKESAVMKSVYKRINDFIANAYTWKDSKHGCNIFSNPDNYLPVLEKYPKLKLCLAHFGGDNELLCIPEEIIKRKIDDNTPYWAERIKNMLRAYDNVYTDISYTLVNPKAMDVVMPILEKPAEETDKNGKPLKDRILFGTDFYMTSREKEEDTIWQECMKRLGMDMFNHLAGTNNDNYMKTTFYDPAIKFS